MWPSIVIIDQLLTEEDLRVIKEKVSEGGFLDGAITADGANLAVKDNLELAAGPHYVEIVKIVEQAVRQNHELNRTIFPRSITRAIINKYDRGMSYGPHIDSPVMGFMSQAQALGSFGQNYVRSDFSMTVFLSDPDSYEGGELSFGSPWGEHVYKLAAGSAVAYPTGLHHQVAPVEYGCRLAAVLWLQSMIRSHEMRRLVADLNRLAMELSFKYGESKEADLASDLAADALRLVAEV